MSYYTPSIEEFYVGFEYEMLYPNYEYIKHIFGDNIKHPQLLEFRDDLMKISHGILRVKHLDKSDIVSLGWEYDNNAEPIPPREGEFELPYAYIFEQGLNQYVMYVYKDNTLWIEHILDCSYQGYIFKGSCRNKSELSKIMKFLNIKLTN